MAGSPILAEIMAAARSHHEWVRELRRDFHRHPEVSGCEERTAAVVADTLGGLGIEVRTGIGGTGVVGVVRGKGPGVSGLRADMDALPMDEENDVEYRSVVPGVMHACGHDAHTAMLLGAARILADLAGAGRVRGAVVLLFQPAEEAEGGAEPMIRDGALDDPTPERVFAQHVWPGLRVGQVSVSAGPISAGVDRADICITGAGGHGAAPHTTPDPILAASHVVTSLQAVVSRGIDPLEPAVVTVGSMHGGTKRNIIPPSVTLELTIRTASAGTRSRVEDLIRQVATGVSEAHGCRCEIQYSRGYPAVINDLETSELVVETATSLIGEDSVHPAVLSMGGEDFSYFAERAPGCMWRLGVSNPERGLDRTIHHPRFDIDEDALPVGAALLAASAWAHLDRRERGDM